VPKKKTGISEDRNVEGGEIRKYNRISMRPIQEFSVQLLKGSQLKTGVFISRPYEQGSRIVRLGHCVFACFALDLIGEHENSRRFYSWALEGLRKREGKIRSIVKKVKEGVTPVEHELLTSAFNPDGSELGEDDHHNLGDYGALLWGFVEHVHRSGSESLIDEYENEIRNLVEYLSSLWQLPSRDFWNLNPDKIHVSTLAQVAGGLNWINAYLMRGDIDKTSNEIQSFLWSKFVEEDHLTSSYDVLKDQCGGLDATILLLASPFQVVSGEDPILKRTASLIEHSFLEEERDARERKYNVARVIPAALLLTLYYKSVKSNKNAEKVLSWVEAAAMENKILPEFDEKGFVSSLKHGYDTSVRKTSPSILSHALYLIASLE